MKQMITRLDDELRANLKVRAAAEGRSVNELVTQLLADARVPVAGTGRAVSDALRADRHAR